MPHPAYPPAVVDTINGSVWQDDGAWHFRYLAEGVDALVLPGPADRGRADGLWNTTCFEAFVGLNGATYLEFNFSPSGHWAAYRFDAPRQGMREEPAEVEVWLEGGETWIAVEARVSCKALEAGRSLGLSAVIAESSGKSYWALGHAGDAPDFHDRTCFRALLADIAAS